MSKVEIKNISDKGIYVLRQIYRSGYKSDLFMHVESIMPGKTVEVELFQLNPLLIREFYEEANSAFEEVK